MSEQLDLFDVGASPLGRGLTAADDDLPKVAREILHLVGLESLLRVVSKWGGRHLDFPTYVQSFHGSEVVQALAEEIGQADALKIAGHYIGARLQVPNCKVALRKVTQRKIREEMDRGVPASELARRYQLHERSIWRIAKMG